MQDDVVTQRARLTLLVLLAWGLALSGPAPAAAEPAWIRAEVRLNLRTGPGSSYRILDMLQTGDAVTILERAEGWTKVESADGKLGWIPAGYLQATAPPTIRLAQLEREVTQLRGQLETVTAQREQLQQANEQLQSTDAQQRQRITELDRETERLKGGQRWPEWITGAGVLCVGMLLGMLWTRSAGRRSGPRIRL